jgi:hypothetical protein
MGRFTHTRLARMSSGHYCLIRDLGLVKGGKGLRHHEVVLDLSWRGLFRSLKSLLRSRRTEEAPLRPDNVNPIPIASAAGGKADWGAFDPDVALRSGQRKD